MNLSRPLRLSFALAGLGTLAPLSTVASPAEVFAEICAEASPDELYQFLFAMPKGGDLHHHFGGSVPMEYVLEYYRNPEKRAGRNYYVRTRIEFCEEAEMLRDVLFQTISEYEYEQLDPCLQSQFTEAMELSDAQIQGWTSGLKLDQPHEGRDEFFEETWWRLGPAFADAEIAAELLVENMKAFSKEGVRYMEIQTAPWGRADRYGNEIDPEEWYQIFKDRLAQPDAIATGVTIRFQIVILRFLPNAEDYVRRAYAFIDSHRDLFVGINMAGREDNGKGQAARFTEVYREMQRIYPKIPLAIHAGEADEANSNIRDTLLLGAERIGHGVNILKDDDTYLLMRNNDYLIEIQLISNQLLEYVEDLGDHHFPVLLRTGVPVALSTDDRAMWDSTFTDEYFTAVTHYNLSWDELVTVGRNSLEYSFLDPATKAELIAAYDADIAAFESEFLSEDWRKPVASVEPIISNYGKATFGLEGDVNLDELP
jgi:adenosine deaminase CECR1